VKAEHKAEEKRRKAGAKRSASAKQAPAKAAQQSEKKQQAVAEPPDERTQARVKQLEQFIDGFFKELELVTGRAGKPEPALDEAQPASSQPAPELQERVIPKKRSRAAPPLPGVSRDGVVVSWWPLCQRNTTSTRRAAVAGRALVNATSGACAHHLVSLSLSCTCIVHVNTRFQEAKRI